MELPDIDMKVTSFVVGVEAAIEGAEVVITAPFTSITVVSSVKSL